MAMNSNTYRIPKELAFEMCKEYQKGTTVAYIANKFKISRESLYNILERNGVELRNRSTKKAYSELESESREILWFYKHGLTMAELAKMYGVTNYRMRRYLIDKSAFIPKPEHRGEIEVEQTVIQCTRCKENPSEHFTAKHAGLCVECYQEYRKELKRKYW